MNRAVNHHAQLAKDAGDLLVTGVRPSNAVESRLDIIVFILVFNAGHRQFTCHWCPNLNLRQLDLSESESEANSTHRLGVSAQGGVCLGGVCLRGCVDSMKVLVFGKVLWIFSREFSIFTVTFCTKSNMIISTYVNVKFFSKLQRFTIYVFVEISFQNKLKTCSIF